jgi:hypothetical protein
LQVGRSLPYYNPIFTVLSPQIERAKTRFSLLLKKTSVKTPYINSIITL